MMTRIILEIPRKIQVLLWRHLLPRESDLEEAAFVYTNRERQEEREIFQYIEWFPVVPNGFASQSGFHFELRDETRASVIKRAHNLQASLVEFHSHRGLWPAQFSPSDVLGFREFVPHIWWRLKRRPYLAVVVTGSGFDGFAWLNSPIAPQRLDGLDIGEEMSTPTGLSLLSMDYWNE